jgi:hypothetical protein
MRKAILMVCAAAMLATSTGCLIPMYSGDPVRRAQQLIYTSEDLRAITDEWERIWFLDQPSHMTPWLRAAALQAAVAAAFAAALGTRARGAACGGCVPGCAACRSVETRARCAACGGCVPGCRKRKKDRHHPPVATEKWRE